MPQTAKRELRAAKLALSAMLATRKYTRKAKERCASRLQRALDELEEPPVRSVLIGTVTAEDIKDAAEFALRGCRVCPVYMSCRGRI